MTRGYCMVGLHMPKTEENIGGALRAAHVYGAAAIVISQSRVKAGATDTTKAWRHMPVLRVDGFTAVEPHDCHLIAVDIIDGAEPLPLFRHPMRAFYIFGPEDGTLPLEVTNRCSHRVSVPTRYCMNLAATVNVVLYDRMAKAMRAAE